jgi:acetoin utilization deacetylase AcuC-like enzyme
VRLIVAGPLGQSNTMAARSIRNNLLACFRSWTESKALGLGDDVPCPPTPKAELPELLRVHSQDYLDELQAFCLKGGGDIDPDDPGYTLNCR